MNGRGLLYGAGIGMLALALAACGGSPDPGPSTDPAPVTKGSPPQPVVPTTWPLTGVPVAEVPARPALAIKVENAPAARPQTGLEKADVVWEEVVEGGITRFMAVYHSQQPELVGPVRSVRPMDPAIVAPLHGILAYTGGQPPFIKAVGAAGVQSVVMDQGDDGFERMRGRRAPHNILGRTADFWKQADAEHGEPPPTQFAFALGGAPGTVESTGTPVGVVDITLTHASRAVWSWRVADQVFARAEGAEPAVSAGGVPLTATNVVVLRVTMTKTAYKDPAGAPVPETKLIGTGEGIVASVGKQLPVTWSKKSNDAPLELSSPTGYPVRLEPGTTWVELVPTSRPAVVSTQVGAQTE